jgi:hypothetical protein
MLAALSLVGSQAALARGDCRADVSVDLMHEAPSGDVTHYQFHVEIGTDESCAEIEYDLILEKQIPNGQTKRVRKPGLAKLKDGRYTAQVRYSMSSDMKLLDYEARIHSCRACDLMR